MKLLKNSYIYNVSYFLRNNIYPLEALEKYNPYNSLCTSVNNQKTDIENRKETEIDNSTSSAIPKKRKPNGLQRDCELKSPLKEFLNLNRASRIYVLKYAWKYIKANNLQNPDKKRQIIPDAKLKQVLNKDEVDMLEMPKLLFKHMINIREE